MKKTLIRSLCAVLLCSCLAVCAGCDSSVKDMAAVLRSGAAAKESYEAPQKWTDTLTTNGGRLEIVLDAEIQLPGVAAYPVYRVAPAGLTEEAVASYMDLLMQGRPVYEPKREEDKTKAELDADILAARQQLEDPSSELNAMQAADPAAYAEARQYYLGLIEQLETQKKNAPEVYVPKPAEAKLIDQPQLNLRYLSVVSDFDNGMQGQFSANVYADNKNDCLSFQLSDGQRIPGGLLTDRTENLPGIEISMAEAKEQAEAFLSRLGITGMALAAVGSMPYVSDEEILKGNLTAPNLPQCYVLRYTREVDGVLTNYVNSGGFRLYGGTGDQSWKGEWINLLVSDDGVLNFFWQSPLAVGEKLSENAPLLPFSQIKNGFIKQAKASLPQSDDPSVLSRKLRISKIVLGYARVPAPDNQGEGLLVPVWDFYGSYSQKYADTVEDGSLDENHEKEEQVFCHSFLTLNAIDGSVVERS